MKLSNGKIVVGVTSGVLGIPTLIALGITIILIIVVLVGLYSAIANPGSFDGSSAWYSGTKLRNWTWAVIIFAIITMILFIIYVIIVVVAVFLMDELETVAEQIGGPLLTQLGQAGLVVNNPQAQVQPQYPPPPPAQFQVQPAVLPV